MWSKIFAGFRNPWWRATQYKHDKLLAWSYLLARQSNALLDLALERTGLKTFQLPCHYATEHEATVCTHQKNEGIQCHNESTEEARFTPLANWREVL